MPTTTLNAAPSGTAVPTPMVVAAARVLSARHADTCGIDAGDMWKTYSDDFIADAQAALDAAGAPLMLEALKTLHDKTAELIAHLQSTDRLRPCFNLPAIETARAAIAAATGAQGGES